MVTQQADVKKSTLIVPSRMSPTEEGAEETEIAAQISVPEEGLWGWLVVATSFMCILVTDGVFFTFGTIKSNLSEELGVEDALIALINSVGVALYFISGPVVSALINRFGFRACAMSGSVVCSTSLICTYFSAGYGFVIIFYGITFGIGGCLLGMTSGIVAGFYFEKMRSVALAITGSGSSVGIMSYSAINTQLLKYGGWRLCTLLHASLFSMAYFFAMSYRPLLSFTVVKPTADPTRTVTFLPNLSTPAVGGQGIKGAGPADRLFGAVSNAHFPTAASVLEEGVLYTSEPGPSVAPGAVSKLKLIAHNPEGGYTERQLKQVKSLVTKASGIGLDKQLNIEVEIKIPKQKKKRWWEKLCHWEKHVAESRPMYRDDIFYQGKITKLEQYQKSMVIPEDAKTGLEYQMAVSRAVTADDIKDQRGIFTTAVRRILATMLDPRLLKRRSFLCLAMANFMVYLGIFVPYVYVIQRNLDEGKDPKDCEWFLIIIGLASLIGRLVIGSMGTFVSPLKLLKMCIVMVAMSIIAFNFSLNIEYQFFNSFVFGLFASGVASVRSLVIVQLFGLDMLTNATGMLLMFNGVASLISTPICGAIKSFFGFAVSFYVAGVLILGGILVLLPMAQILKKEQNLKPN